MKTLVTIEARMSSSRLPGKVLKTVLGKPLIEYMLERLERIQLASDIIVATTTNPADDALVDIVHKRGFRTFRGSEEDVLLRVLQAAKGCQADLIVETTADCPLIDPIEANKVIQYFITGNFDYVSNILTRSYPIGMDTQVFPTSVLEEVNQLTQNPSDREHVSYYIYNHPKKYRLGNVHAPKTLYDPELRLTVDTAEDFSLIEAIIEGLWVENPEASLKDILEFLKRNPELRSINSHVRQKMVNA